MAGCSVSFIFFIFVLLLLVLKKLFWLQKAPSLKNKHVLVTGGSSGIGKSTAIEASKLGANVTVLARDEVKLKAAVEEIRNSAKFPKEQKIQYYVLDVTKGLNAVEEAIVLAEDATGPIFLLVNCAGVAVCGEFETVAESDYRYMMELNYFGTIFPTLTAAKRMKRRKEGHVVVTGSQASLLGIHGMSAYCPSKFALRGFAESLFMELKPYNVSVTLCVPPDTNTPGYITEQKSKPKITKLISETDGLYPPEDVARQLLSDALRKKFFSSVGLEGLVLTTLCSGMSPIDSYTNAFLQISLMSLLRFVSIFYHFHFHSIIKTHSQTGKELKKIE